jgi:hypothetical protein
VSDAVCVRFAFYAAQEALPQSVPGTAVEEHPDISTLPSTSLAQYLGEWDR